MTEILKSYLLQVRKSIKLQNFFGFKFYYLSEEQEVLLFYLFFICDDFVSAGIILLLVIRCFFYVFRLGSFFWNKFIIYNLFCHNSGGLVKKFIIQCFRLYRVVLQTNTCDHSKNEVKICSEIRQIQNFLHQFSIF